MILDRLWLDAADLELTTAAEAAALAAASNLASDDLLKLNPDSELRLELARTAAAYIAGQNLVAGSPVVLDTTPLGDVRLGQLVLDDALGMVRFAEATDNPTTAVVTATRTRQTSNPVGLFVAGLTNIPFGDVTTRVEATVDNRISGVRALEGAPVPALPLAIWWKDPAGLRSDTWDVQIEARRGADNYGFDPVGRQVYSGADGIPEIVLRSQARGQQLTQTNVTVVDVGTRLNDQELARQFLTGWTIDDMGDFDGEFRLPQGGLVTLQASAELRSADRDALQSLIGEPRICLLYSGLTPNGTLPVGQAACIRMVSIRVLAVNDLDSGACEVVAQPCIVKTRTAIVDDMIPYYTNSAAGTPAPLAEDNSASNLMSRTAVLPNPYIYKLRLTH